MYGSALTLRIGTHAPQNTGKWFDAYRECANILGYRTSLRRPLPHCVVAHIRLIFSSADGHYVGYHGP